MRKPRVLFSIRTPRHKGRASFGIVRDEVKKDGKRDQPAVYDERINAINRAYKAGKCFEECLVLIQEVQKDLYKAESQKSPTVVHNQDNLKILDDYFKLRYSHRRNVREGSKKSMYYDLLRAVEALGALSLYSASEKQLQDAINRRFSGNKQRRAVMRLRQILKFINRHDVQLQLDFEDDRLVPFLGIDEVRELLEHIKDDRVLTCLVAIGAFAGLRLGEIYALEPHKLKGTDRLFVDRQLLPDGSSRKPKHNRVRDAYIIAEGAKYIEEWLDLPEQMKSEYRRGNNRIPKAVRRACKRLWPKDPRKHLNFHDTRHCYGVHLVSHSISTDILAKFMGNSPEVCRKHYQGFIASDAAFDAVRFRLGTPSGT